jgi:ATP-dependent RNA helicase DeaD
MSADISTTHNAASDGVTFRDLALGAPVLKALESVGYETPSPIQAATIPHLLGGRDVLGQAQTGTGKTAAFALPILSQVDLHAKLPQALVLAPTRELAIQVAEAFQKYAANLPGFHVLPIYGGQSYEPQLKALRRGVHVVVGTPGRVLDHMKRGTLNLSALKCLVLDEADEMLRMGFIDDVEFVLKETPPTRQVALFSATMPSQIRRIAQTYLHDPAEVTIRSKTTTATNIRQRYWLVSGVNKLDALTRILEAEDFDGLLIFARTKAATQELAEKLEARGFAAAALNGDMEQKARERTVARLKNGDLDIVVATDIAARGLDVERISHVVNYDIPTDTESYVHRIGRTGRAGRSGEAILFIAPRERHLLKAIERATRQNISAMELPSVAAVNDQRIARFKTKIAEALTAGGLDPFRSLIEDYEREHNVPAIEIAAALARMAQGDTPLLMADANANRERGYSVPAAPTTRSERPAARPVSSQASAHPAAHPVDKPAPRAARLPYEQSASSTNPEPAARAEPIEHSPRPERTERIERPARAEFVAPPTERPKGPEPIREVLRKARTPRMPGEEDVPKETFRLEVGEQHGVKPANIVGAIANEAGVDANFIGRIDIRADYSLVDLPMGMPKQIFRDLQKVWVCGQQLKLSRAGADTAPHSAPRPKFVKPAKPAKPSGKFNKPRRDF